MEWLTVAACVCVAMAQHNATLTTTTPISSGVTERQVELFDFVWPIMFGILGLVAILLVGIYGPRYERRLRQEALSGYQAMRMGDMGFKS